jgi:hypothetical protein
VAACLPGVLYVNNNRTQSIAYNFNDTNALIGLLVRTQGYLTRGDD